MDLFHPTYFAVKKCLDSANAHDWLLMHDAIKRRGGWLQPVREKLHWQPSAFVLKTHAYILAALLTSIVALQLLHLQHSVFTLIVLVVFELAVLTFQLGFELTKQKGVLDHFQRWTKAAYWLVGSYFDGNVAAARAALDDAVARHAMLANPLLLLCNSWLWIFSVNFVAWNAAVISLTLVVAERLATVLPAHWIFVAALSLWAIHFFALGCPLSWLKHMRDHV